MKKYTKWIWVGVLAAIMVLVLVVFFPRGDGSQDLALYNAKVQFFVSTISCFGVVASLILSSFNMVEAMQEKDAAAAIQEKAKFI